MPQNDARKFDATCPESRLHGHVVVDLRRNSKTEEVSVIGRDREKGERSSRISKFARSFQCQRVRSESYVLTIIR